MIPEKLLQEIGSSSQADISAEHARQVGMVMRVAINSTHLKDTYIRDLKTAATFFSAAWKDRSRKARRESHSRDDRSQELEQIKEELAMLRRENGELRSQLAEERAERARGLPTRRGRESQDRDPRLDALERKVDMIGPQIASEIMVQVKTLLGGDPPPLHG